MVSRLGEFPTFLSFLAEKVFQFAETSPAGIVDETLASLIAFDDLSFVTR